MIIRREKRLLRVQLKLIKQTEQRYIITYYNIHLNEESRSFRLQKKKRTYCKYSSFDFSSSNGNKFCRDHRAISSRACKNSRNVTKEFPLRFLLAREAE